jgi:cell wall-associated NlpC family hydrolase
MEVNNIMRKILLAGVLVSSLLFTELPHAAFADGVQTKATIEQSVSFRTSPNTNGAFIRYLKTNETVVVLEKVNTYWYKVQDQSGRTGYVSANDKYIEVASNAVVRKAVTLRKEPSTTGTKLGTLSKGSEVLVLSKVNNYWFKVQSPNGVVGYASADSQYLEVNGLSAGVDLSKNEQIEAVIAAGMKYLGTPYEFGSDRGNTSTFDCSDFVRQAFKDGIDVMLPSDSRQQGDYVKNIGKSSTSLSNFKRGDLIFFMSYEGYKKSNYEGIHKANERITHVGIYLGDGKMLHTYSASSGGVRVDSIGNNSWEYRIIHGGSAL